MSHREFLLQRYYDKTATTEELVELARIMAEERYKHEDELFNQLMKSLQQQEYISDEDKNHVAANLYFKRADMETVGEEKSGEAIPIKRSRKYAWWSVAAAVVVAIGLAWYNYGVKENTTGELATVQTAADSLIIIRSGNSTKFVELPDGSTVLLNKASELTYIRKYGVDTRVVTLTGEGFFDVAHNPFTPFQVKTGRLVTTVLGTAFNIKVVKASSGGNKYTVTVSRGKVSVADDNRELGTITKNEQIAVNTENNTWVRSTVKAELATAWTDQFIIINNQRLEEAVAMVAARFNVKILLENKELKDCRFTAAFLDRPKLEVVLNVISTVMHAKYTIKDDTVTIHGGECVKEN